MGSQNISLDFILSGLERLNLIPIFEHYIAQMARVKHVKGDIMILKTK